MAPKAPVKKKKKTKEELEAERLLAEEEARKAEEVRIKAEQEAAKKREEEQQRLLELQAEQLATEAQRLETERAEAAARDAERKQACQEKDAQLDDEREWLRYKSCSPLPDPLVESQVSTYLTLRSEAELNSMPDTMRHVQDALTILNEADAACTMAAQRNDTAEVARLLRCKRGVYAAIAQQVDGATAWFLHHCDYFADADGNVKSEEVLDCCGWAIWLNIHKNPRLETVDFPALGLQLEVTKQLALASIAIRAQILDAADEHFEECSNEWYAVGSVIKVDLLALPPMSKPTANDWVLRVHSAYSSKLQHLPYPVPPAGVDPSSWHTDEEAPPLGFHTSIVPDIVQLADMQLEVGMWNSKAKAWDTDKVSHVATNDGCLSFKATAVAPCAVVCSRAALLPYQGWHVRPCAGERGDRAMLAVDVGMAGGEMLEFEVSTQGVALQAPALAPLADVLGTALPPRTLLSRLKRCGLFLLPEPRDATLVDVVAKDDATEAAACTDVASLAGSHLIASSKWTQYVEAGQCICRVSEVRDWEGGGRTSAAHLARIFDTELETGATRVIALLRTGSKGVAFSKALNRCAAYPEVPEYTDERRKSCVWGEVHASALALMHANFAAELSDETVVEIAAREEAEAKKRQLESKRQAELEEYAKKGEKAPEELQQPVSVPLPERPLYWPTDWPQVAQELQPGKGTLERARDFSAITAEALAQLMYALRLFSFSVR